jgi:hypothetical protein
MTETAYCAVVGAQNKTGNSIIRPIAQFDALAQVAFTAADRIRDKVSEGEVRRSYRDPDDGASLGLLTAEPHALSPYVFDQANVAKDGSGRQGQ